MLGFSIALLIVIAALATVQSTIAARFIAYLRAFRREEADAGSLPEAVVVLAVRGRDPFLADTLGALLEQDYPRYAIHIVLDGAVDSGRTVVESVLSRPHAANVTIDVLRDPLHTCTLKCSALRQAVADLQTRYEVIAFIDGDAVPHRHWLRDLVTPLSDPAVGVTTGNRWYMPHEANWGSLVRYFWNAGAVVQMWLNGIVWAGSMALRSDTIRRIGLLDAWGRALSVDNTVCRQIRRHGYRVRFVPGAVAVNTERIALTPFLVWVQRQLVGVRTSLRSWFVILLHAGLFVLVQLVPVALATAALVRGEPLVAVLSGLALAGVWLISFVTAMGLEGAVRRIVRLNGGRTRWITFRMLPKLFPAMLLTLVVYPVALAKATFCRRVVWRGIEYEVTARNQVRMVKYHPFPAADDSVPTGSVL